ncbi:MAG: hypothetical protein V4592_24745 [Bacteroidota bacterium]
MSFTVKLSEEAIQTYDALTDQLRQRWGDAFVDKFATKVSKSLSTISISPYIYPVYSSDIRSCVLHKNCSMLYRIINSDVLVICFWDNRQDPIFTF